MKNNVRFDTLESKRSLDDFDIKSDMVISEDSKKRIISKEIFKSYKKHVSEFLRRNKEERGIKL